MTLLITESCADIRSTQTTVMSIPARIIPQHSVDILAKGTYREAVDYGFDKNDILRFVNSLLQLSMQDLEERVDEQGEPHPRSPGIGETPISSSKVRIRAFEQEFHEELLLHWLDDPEGQHFLRSRMTAHPIPFRDFINDELHVLGIIETLDGTPIGCMAFLEVDHVQHKAELRKLIGVPSYRNRGYAKAASELWIRFGLEDLGLRKVYLNTLASNIRNIRLNEQLGFSVEGILRNEMWLNGSYVDIVRMALYNI